MAQNPSMSVNATVVRHDRSPTPRATVAAVTRTSHSLANVTLEQVLWAVLIVVAAVSRFWDLSYRALMHDESLHAYYSWWLYRGFGYVHDPLMHGPFLFHASALSDFLFGDTDASSRFPAAVAGVGMVAVPWLLRSPQLLGRWGALLAGFFFLISPSILYYTRFIRHDPYTTLGTLLLVVAIFRYLERPHRRWLLLGGAMIGFLYTNHEIVFALVAIFVGILTVGLLLTTLRPLLPVAVATGILGFLVLAIHKVKPGALGGPLPAIPWDAGSTDPAMRPTPENQRHFYAQLLTHPMTIALAVVVVLGLIGCWVVIRERVGAAANQRDEYGQRRGWVEVMCARAPDGTLGAGFRNAWRDKTGLQLALMLLIAICAILFTSFFTLLHGLSTATIATDGTLLYWLGQQNVRRGSQPWFYFLTLVPQYELLMLGFGIPMIVATFWRAIRDLVRRHGSDPRQRFRLFCAFWATGITFALSYAGEKMPWLTVHIAVPMILLAASLLNEIFERWSHDARAGASAAAGRPRGEASARPWYGRGSAQGAWVIPWLAAAILAIGGCWLLIAARVTTPRWINQNDVVRRGIFPDMADQWWTLILPPLILLVLLGVAIWLAGATRTARAAIVALLLGLTLLQTHQAYRLSFEQGDVARDGLIYNTTTPDVQRMVSDLTQLSYATSGDLSLAIQYDDDTSWPMNWYFRDFTNASRNSTVGPTTDAPIIIMSDTNARSAKQYLSGNYTAQQYVLRWHEPEQAIYRNFAIAPELEPSESAWGKAEYPHGIVAIVKSIWSSITTQTTESGQQRLWRLVFYREMPAETINYGYTIFIRNDVLPTYNAIHYDEQNYTRPNA